MYTSTRSCTVDTFADRRIRSCGNPTISAKRAARSADSTIASSVTAQTGATLSYQWKKGGVDIPGATSASLTRTGVAIGDTGSYSVTVTSTLNGTSVSSTSNAASFAAVSISTISSAVPPLR